jgi:hypothetical protein
VIQSFLELSRALLHLLEETHIRDRDYRLIGESLQNCNLTFGEWLHVETAESDAADRSVPLQ